ncbi:MAG: winged helix-turn-helix transcriptional regulator [Sporichthyaceae bacterium]
MGDAGRGEQILGGAMVLCEQQAGSGGVRNARVGQQFDAGGRGGLDHVAVLLNPSAGNVARDQQDPACPGERDGLLTRTVHPVVPPRVEYELTPLGADLSGPLAVLEAWARDNLSEVVAARAAYDAR